MIRPPIRTCAARVASSACPTPGARQGVRPVVAGEDRRAAELQHCLGHHRQPGAARCGVERWSRAQLHQHRYPGGLRYISEEYANDRRVTGGTDRPAGTARATRRWSRSRRSSSTWAWSGTSSAGAVAGVSLFRKNVDNFTVPVVRDQQMNVGGQSVTVQKYETQANGRDGVSQGVGCMANTPSTSVWACRPTTPTTTPTWPRSCWTARKSAHRRWSAAPRTRPTSPCSENDKFLARASYNRRGEVVGGLNNGMTTHQAVQPA